MCMGQSADRDFRIPSAAVAGKLIARSGYEVKCYLTENGARRHGGQVL
jgi:hypothetical protein